MMMSSKETFISRLWGRKSRPVALQPDDVDVYSEYKVIESSWGEDAELIQEWFAQGESIRDDSDWIYWVDLYKPRATRADLMAHWFRCLFDRTLPRPRELGAA